MSRPGPVLAIAADHSLASTVGDRSDRALHHSVRVAASPADTFAAWTTAAGIAAWFCPRCDVRLEIGGPFEIYFVESAPAGSQGSEGCRFVAFDPDRMVAFTWNAPPHLDRTRPQYTHVVVYFEAVAGGTEVTLRHVGWPGPRAWDADEQWPETFAYFDGAWPRVLANLQAHLGAAE